MVLWFPQVGLETQTSPENGTYLLRSSNPILKAPVPEIACEEATLPYLTGVLVAPKTKSLAN